MTVDSRIIVAVAVVIAVVIVVLVEVALAVVVVGVGSGLGMKIVLVALGTISLFLLLAAVVLTQPTSRAPLPRLAGSADSSRLERSVRTLAGPLSPRDAERPASLRRAAGWIEGELRGLGLSPVSQDFRVEQSTFRNVLASVGPRGGVRIVVGAHYDAAGPYPGADDNASGVAGLLELARLFAQVPPPLEVELAFYTLEEPPWFGRNEMGSAVHARSLVAQGTPVRAMLCLEMIGTFIDAPRSQTFPLPVLRLLYPDRGNFIAVVGKLGQGRLVRAVKRAMRAATDLPVYSINAPRLLPGVDLSDHASFWDQGFAAAMITDTAFYRNPRYHTERDTPEHLDYRKMAQVVDGVRAAVHALAQ